VKTAKVSAEALDRPGSNTMLWFGFLGGAVGWKLQLLVNYSLVPYACVRDMTLLIHLASAVSLGVALAAGAAALASWRRTGGYPFGWEGDDTEGGPTVTRSRFMAVAGLLMSGYFAMVVLTQWLPTFFLDPCWS
jgi:hypothetical protein